MFGPIPISQADEAGRGLMGHVDPGRDLVLLGKTDESAWLTPTLLFPCHCHILANRASISGHESGARMRKQAGERIMSVKRAWKPVGSVNSSGEIEHLRLELASFNERIEELEKQQPDALKIEALRVSALLVARQIDEIRCSSSNDLTDSLAK
jgi:hypothetical protein